MTAVHESIAKARKIQRVDSFFACGINDCETRKQRDDADSLIVVEPEEMMPELSAEEIAGAMPLAIALRTKFPPGRNGKPVHLTTGVRWITHGVGPRRVRLAGFKNGAAWVVTERACLEFLAKLNSTFAESPLGGGELSAVNEDRRVNETSRALEALGC